MHLPLLSAPIVDGRSARAFSSIARAALLLMLWSLSGEVLAETEYYEYDALGRLVGVQHPNGLQKIYSYDPAGNRTLVYCDDGPVDDDVPTTGIGPNLINLSSWPTEEVPSSAPQVPEWPSGSTYYNEARWARSLGPGNSSCVTAMETGQTQPDANGGGVNPTNSFTIDPTKGYEFTIYFRKYDFDWQSLYFGTKTGGMVKAANSNSDINNPYFLSWNTTTQTTYLDASKWYKVVAYVLPEGYPIQSNSNWGGIFEVTSGSRIASVKNYRWSEDRSSNQAYARFFTYYSQENQNTFTNYFFLPEVRVTSTSYSPVVPNISIAHSNATEGQPLSFTLVLSEPTTVTTKVYYTIDHPGGSGSASAGDYTASSSTQVVFPQGVNSAAISVNTTGDNVYEVNEAVRLRLSSPSRAVISESSELAYIVNDDPAPSISITDQTGTEGENLIFTVARSGQSQVANSISYSTANGTATAGQDYVSQSGALSFGTGDSSKTISVSTMQDSNSESSETFHVNLSSPTGGATIADNQGRGTILNGNSPPVAVNDSYFFFIPHCCPSKDIYPLTNDSDADNDSLSITSITPPPFGMSATLIAPDTIRLNPPWNQDYTGSFTYTITDGRGGTDTATIAVTIETPY